MSVDRKELPELIQRRTARNVRIIDTRAARSIDVTEEAAFIV
jgi:hypothetical protein